LDDFSALDYEDRWKQSRQSENDDSGAGMTRGHDSPSNVITNFFQNTFGHLKKLFAVKLHAYVFVVLAVA
jgi:hypothetical protein